jgi:AbrB family looped-hinge helix DNA binding protein
MLKKSRMTNALISPKFQIVIPKEIRQTMGLKTGQRLSVTLKNGYLELHPILNANQLIGYLKKTKPLEFERDADREF